MAYKKWVANADRHNDWTTELITKDGSTIRMGEPVELDDSQVEELAGQGRVFEDSSAEEAEEYQQQAATGQQPGSDVAGTAPVFQTAAGTNQESGVDQEVDQPTEAPSGDES